MRDKIAAMDQAEQELLRTILTALKRHDVSLNRLNDEVASLRPKDASRMPPGSHRGLSPTAIVEREKLTRSIDQALAQLEAMQKPEQG
jgi:hypothetical protein